MGIFEKRNQVRTLSRNSTNGFYFGASEAEGENVKGSSLLDYFEDYLNILDQLEAGKFIFTGRKGVGKSAIAKYITDISDTTEKSFAKLLRISDFELEKSIQIPEIEESKEQLIFEWLILVNMVKLIISNESAKYTTEYTKLKKFLDINSGIVNIDKYQVVDGERNKGGEASFGVLKHIFGGILKHYFKTNVNKAPFYKLIPPLKEILKIILDYPVNKNIEFWLLFDDLDINFNVKSDTDNDKLIELIRIAKSYNNEVFKNNNSKILIFIRDDIRDNLLTKYADSAKIFATYEIFIDWYNHSDSSSVKENDIPLKALANKRIALNFKNRGIKYEGDPWDTLFKSDEDYYGKTSFKYVLDFTFYRPRDIINFLNTLTISSYSYPINKQNLKLLLKKYIVININEIKSELKLFFSDDEIEIIFTFLIPFIFKSENVYNEEMLKKIDELNFSIESEKVLVLLRKYLLIVPRDSNGNLYFKYRDRIELELENGENFHFTLPKCIYHKYKYIN